MLSIYGIIYHQYTPNVSIYTSTMDPMGIGHISHVSHVGNHSESVIASSPFIVTLW